MFLMQIMDSVAILNKVRRAKESCSPTYPTLNAKKLE